jgi:catalase
VVRARTATLNLPVFPDSSPQGFYDRLLASKPSPDTGKPDPKAMAAFLAEHPETAKAMKVIGQSPPTPGFADSTFRSLNTFYFISESGTRTPVRWSLVPVTPPATSKLVRSQRALRRPGPPDPFRPTAMDVDAHRRRTV